MGVTEDEQTSVLGVGMNASEMKDTSDIVEKVMVGVVFRGNRFVDKSAAAEFVGTEQGMDDGLSEVRRVLTQAGQSAGVSVTDEWLSRCSSLILQEYASAFDEWVGDMKNTVAFYYEFLVDDTALVLGDPRVLMALDQGRQTVQPDDPNVVNAETRLLN